LTTIVGMKLTMMDETYWAERRLGAEREFPGSTYGNRPDLTAEAIDAFEDALHAGSLFRHRGSSGQCHHAPALYHQRLSLPQRQSARPDPA